MALPHQILASLGIAVFTVLGGCTSTPATTQIPLIDIELPAEPVAKPPIADFENSDTVLSVADIAVRHNARVAGLHDLWAQAEVSLSWKDEESRSHDDNFGGYLMLQRPNNVYLSLDKAGELAMVAGCDHEFFWIISLLEMPTATWICRIENIGMEGCDAPPDFLLPHELTLLSGLALIPSRHTDYESIANSDGVVISWSAGNRVRSLHFPAGSWVPDQVSLKSADGAVLAASRLGKYRPVEDETTPEAEWIYAPGYIHVAGPEWNGEAVLRANELRVRPRNRDTVGGITFSFPYLRRAYPTQELHVLDADCPRPAIVSRSE